MSASIIDLVTATAETDPSRVAILGVDGEQLTYAQLQETCHLLRAVLRDRRVAPTDVAALAMPNGPALAALSIATMGSATCAPLNPVSAGPELQYLLDDLRPAVVITLEGRAGRVGAAAAAGGVPLLEVPAGPVIDALRSIAPDGAGRSSLGPPADAAAVALRLHTSGTTGVPKQVPITHENLCAAASQVVRSLDLTAEDRCLNVMPLFHSHGLIGALLASLAGTGSIVCAPGFDPRHVFDWANEAGATWYTAAPTIHQAMLTAPGHHDRFRLVRSASAPLPIPLIEGLEDRFGAPVIEVYGMTEAYQIAANPLHGERRPGTVGVPTGDEIAISKDGQIGREGEGEIVVRGPNVFPGYASPAGANDDAFIDGWFRTGDQGRFDEAAYLQITGRLKEQINRGGEKISPREIDDALLSHPAIAEALSVGIPDEAMGEEVAAAVVTRSGAALEVPELRRYLAERLAPHKVPRRFAFVDQIPTSPGGKPSRARVAEHVVGLLDSSGDRAPVPVAKGSTTLARLAELWTLVLEDSEGVEPDARFFDLGGSSLDVMELVTQVEVVFGVDLPIDDVLELPTLREMAAEIDRLQRGERSGDRHLRVMRPGDAAAAVLLIPGAHGAAIGLQPIADQVTEGPMVVGFAYPGQRSGERPLQSIEGLADVLAGALTRAGVRVAVVFGNSLGSWVAFETARRLADGGTPPAGLVLGDMFSPTLSRAVRGRRRRVVNAARAFAHRWRRRAEARRAVAHQRHDAVLRASNVAMATYRGGLYRGDVSLLTTGRRAARIASPTYSWEDLVDGTIRVTSVPGEHEELHTDHASEIAAQINALLPRLSADGHAPRRDAT